MIKMSHISTGFDETAWCGSAPNRLNLLNAAYDHWWVSPKDAIAAFGQKYHTDAGYHLCPDCWDPGKLAMYVLTTSGI